jgi:hypothetical protein
MGYSKPYKMYDANFKTQGFKINYLKCITINEASFTGGLYCLGKPLSGELTPYLGELT